MADSIAYRGMPWPCVTIRFSQEELDRHSELDGIEERSFADGELWNAIASSGKWEQTDVHDGELDADNEIDYYMDGQACAKFCSGELPEAVMKVKVARVILEW